MCLSVSLSLFHSFSCVCVCSCVSVCVYAFVCLFLCLSPSVSLSLSSSYLDVGIGPSDKRHGRQAHSRPCGYTYLDPQQPRGAHAVTSNVTLHVHLPSYLLSAVIFFCLARSSAISAAIFAFCRHFFCFLSLFLISVVKSAVCRKNCRPICVLSP